jgi:hypothetical protein
MHARTVLLVEDDRIYADFICEAIEEAKLPFARSASEYMQGGTGLSERGGAIREPGGKPNADDSVVGCSGWVRIGLHDSGLASKGWRASRGKDTGDNVDGIGTSGRYSASATFWSVLVCGEIAESSYVVGLIGKIRAGCVNETGEMAQLLSAISASVGGAE